MKSISLAVLILLGAAARADEPAAAEPASPSALEPFFAGIDKDGALDLSEAVRKELVAALPPPGRGEKCEEPAKAHESAVVLKDRGDGALLVATLSSCRGESVYAFAPGSPLRVARLFDNEDGVRLLGALSLPLRGGTGAGELGLVLASHAHNELRFFVKRSERGFAFGPSGTLPGYSLPAQCEGSGPDHAGGFVSLLRVNEARRLLRLRLDSRCGGGLSAARCEVWLLEAGALERHGSCALPAKLEEADLRKAGWR